MILSKTYASLAVARLQQYNLDIAYLGDAQVRLIRSGRVEFHTRPHTMGEFKKNVPPGVDKVLTNQLRVPQDPDLIDVRRVAVQPGDCH